MRVPAAWRLLLIAAGIGGLVVLRMRLARLEHLEPPHSDIALGGGRIATLYAPGVSQASNATFPASGHPPLVILLHGFGSNRWTMDLLARRLARNGYLACAMDLTLGPFSTGESVLRQIRAGVSSVRSSPLVGGTRLAVIGHSMGAGAAMVFAAQEEGLAGAVFISGGCYLAGSARPPNALFVFAAADPARFRESCLQLVARLAHKSSSSMGRTYGDFASGTAVRAVEIHGVSHSSIAFSTAAAGEIARWLDQIFGTQRSRPPELDDPASAVAGLELAVLAATLATILWATGMLSRLRPRLSPRRERN